MTKTKRTLRTATKASVRPAGPDDRCFYCGALVGLEEHQPACVMLKKEVIIRYTVDVPVEVPEAWDKNMIEFRRNDDSWCHNNLISELVDLKGRLEADGEDGCLCLAVTAELVGTVRPVGEGGAPRPSHDHPEDPES